MLETVRLPDKIIRDLSAQFRVIREEDIGFFSELRSGRGIHALLGNLASGVEPSPGLERLSLVGVN